jgi:[ribosomal protein S18]-alanine N-acetyltransferase
MQVPALSAADRPIAKPCAAERATPQISALEARFADMAEADLPEVIAVENAAYGFPWKSGNFADSIKTGYLAQCVWGGVGAGRVLIGYFVAMKGVDELHLLNITVASACRGKGWARVMLDAMALWARGQSLQWIWLEVRLSNPHALSVYQHYGFAKVGQRKNYYPNGAGAHEDAIVMSYKL